MKVIKTIALHCFFGLIIATIGSIIESKFLFTFLKDNIIIIIVALFAINTTTMSVMLSRIHELSNKLNLDSFRNTKSAMKHNVFEQIGLILSSLIVLIVYDSKIIKSDFQNHAFLSDILLVSIFTYSLHILIDTALAVFVFFNDDAFKTEKE